MFKYWKGGHYTIDQISTSTGIPRSTVGYYVKKFSRKYPKDHRENITSPSVEKNKDEGFAVIMRKKLFIEAKDLLVHRQYRDVKELVEGSTIWLPVFVAGAQLVMGDMHAAVGDGAVGGTGAEVAAESHIRVTVEKGKRLRYPRALTPEYFITLASAQRASTAMKRAVREMVDFLSDEKGMDPYDAYSLLSLAGDVRISRTFRPISPCKMMLSRAVYDQLK